MKKAADYRRFARENLRGKWGIAVLGGLIASLLGGTTRHNIDFNFELSGFNNHDYQQSFEFGDFAILDEVLTAIFPFLIGTVISLGIVALIISLLYFVLGSIISLGYTRFNLNLVDGKKPSLGTLFDYFPYWKNAIILRLWETLFIFLWTLLFVIPGIIAIYRYAMTAYILAENPDMPAREVIERSKEMMAGNKWRLFCLHFSFIGWDILASLTFGIGYLWLNPYTKAAEAIFYRDISGTGWAMYAAQQNEGPAGNGDTTEKEFVDLGI